MPRHARKKSKSGIYHVMLRGMNKQDIFEDNEDRQKFLETIRYYKNISKYKIYGYCLMNNHIHLLIQEIEKSISFAIKRISASYVFWYNRKYERCGHLFQERFRSEIVDSEMYFLTVLTYIHQNPVKAGIIENPDEYKWSSYKEFKKKTTWLDVDFVLDIFSNDRYKAIEKFEKFMNEPNEDHCLEYEEKLRVSDNDVRPYFAEKGIVKINELQHLEKDKRNEIIKAIKSIEGVTIRQLSRITGISKSVIDRI